MLSSAPLCAFCGAPVQQKVGSINRALKERKPLYCDRVCAGLARRNGLSPPERVAAKAAYDAARRDRLGEVLLEKKRAAYYVDHQLSLERSAAQRKKPQRRRYHNEYCRTPDYRATKHDYDVRRYATQAFGEEFAEAALALRSLQLDVDTRITRTEVYAEHGRLNRATQEKRKLKWT